MEGVEAAQALPHGECGCALDEALVDVDDLELRPLVAYRPGVVAGQRDGTHDFDEADPADEPAFRVAHPGANGLRRRLVDVALDERARIEVEDQRSSSRSRRMISLAEALPFWSGGGTP